MKFVLPEIHWSCLCRCFSDQSEDAVDSPVAMETETPLPTSQAGAAYSEL